MTDSQREAIEYLKAKLEAGRDSEGLITVDADAVAEVLAFTQEFIQVAVNYENAIRSSLEHLLAIVKYGPRPL